jgi:hypothetical protein
VLGSPTIHRRASEIGESTISSDQSRREGPKSTPVGQRAAYLTMTSFRVAERPDLGALMRR